MAGVAAAAENARQAAAAVERCEAWNVEWQVHATASRLLSRLGQSREAEESPECALRAAQRVAQTLADEPALQQSLFTRVNSELALRASSA